MTPCPEHSRTLYSPGSGEETIRELVDSPVPEFGCDMLNAVEHRSQQGNNFSELGRKSPVLRCPPQIDLEIR